MTNVDFGPAARRLGELVASISDDELGLATPCPAWRTRIPRDLGLLARAWGEPGAWSGMTRIAGQDAPARMVALTAADELVVHGWDVARATGRSYDAEPDMIEAAREFLDAFVSPEMPSGPTVAFGPPRRVAGGVSALERVLALAGRDPSWQPVTGRPA